MDVDGDVQPLAPDRCIKLPARTAHCLEKTGEDVMRILVVVRPAASPAAAYYRDGTSAYACIPSLSTS